MPAHTLVLTPAAKEDLKDIYSYGVRHWGQSKSNKYLDTVKSKIWALTELPLTGSVCNDIYQGIRRLPVERHAIFYRVTIDSVEIIRILHIRQDRPRCLP